MIKKVIIPVAGLGTRFLPVTKAQPKEMLPIVDKPIVQYLVEEAVASGISEVIFVTGRGKRAIEDHFDYAPELEVVLEEKGKKELLEEVRRISRMASFTYVRQREPRGDGDALLCAEHLVGNEPVAILFGDDVMDAKEPALAQMVKVFQKYGDSVVGLTRVPKKDVHKYGVADVTSLDKRTYQIRDFVEKPASGKAPSNLAASGRYIITPAVLKTLKAIKKKPGEELRLADALKLACKTGVLYGYEIDGVRYDCGSKIGFLKATVDFGLKHKETRKEFAAYLRKKAKGF